MTDDLIGRAEAQTAIQFAARRYMVAHEAHGEGQVVWSDNLINVIDAMNVLRDLPSAQPERKPGRWIPDNTDYYRTRFICSVCGESEEVPTMGFGYAPMWGYCPNCGADMRGEKNG